MLFAREVLVIERERGRIVETPTEARQAEPVPSILLLLIVSLALAALILGAVWFVFFRTSRVMRQAAKFQFGRVVRGFSDWRYVLQPTRSPAPAWWWQLAFEVRQQQEQMTPLSRYRLELPLLYAAGASVAFGRSHRPHFSAVGGRVPAQHQKREDEKEPRKNAPWVEFAAIRAAFPRVSGLTL